MLRVTTNGTPAVPAHPSASSNHLGAEPDLVAAYKQNHHVTYGLGSAHTFDGEFLDEATPGKDYSYPFAYSTYIF